MARRRPFNRSKKRPEDQAKEKVVVARIDLELCQEWIVEPKQAVAFGSIGEKRIRGYYLNTQMVLRQGSRKDFAANQSQSAGIPDHFIRLVHWPRAVWIGVELKSEKDNARPSKEQELLESKNAIIITNEDEEVWNAIFEADAVFEAITGQRFEPAVPGRGTKSGGGRHT